MNCVRLNHFLECCLILIWGTFNERIFTRYADGVGSPEGGRAQFVVSRGIAGRYFKEIITYDYVPPSTLSPRGAIASFSLYPEPVLSHVGRSQKVIPS